MEWWTLREYEIEAIVLSLRVSGIAVLASLPLGLFCAWLLARRQFPGKMIIDGLIHLPLVLPPVVVGYTLLIAFGRQGIIGQPLREWFGVSFAFSWQGAALAAAVMSFPLLVRAVRLSMEQVDRGLEQAARTLGASPLRVFFTVTLPLVLPGVLTGLILAFARSLSEFGATITFVSNIPGQTRTLPIALYTFTQVPGGDIPALRLCVLSVILALAALIASEIFARRMQKRLAG
jgi:molybdate transport system permease protein